MKRLLLGPLVALITSFLCFGLTLLVAQIINLSLDPQPLSADPIDTYKVSGKHFDGDFVVGVCSLHQMPFKRGKTEPYCGSALYEKEYKKAREELFPNSNGNGNKPTVASQDTSALIQYCEKCREAEASWIKAHKEK